MILKDEFRNWLVNQYGLKPQAADVNVARMVRINNVYDVAAAYAADGCVYLLQLFTYTTEDSCKGLQPDHDVVIVGNYYTGTQSLKYALRRYIEFLNQHTSLHGSAASVSEDERFDDVSDEEFMELLEFLRNMGPLEKSAREMLEEMREDVPNEHQEEVEEEGLSTNVEEEEPPFEDEKHEVRFMGSFQDFSRYVGPFCKNYVNSITKVERTSHHGICEYCGKKATLESAHRDGEERPMIIRKILETHFKKGPNYYDVNIEQFEKMFRDAHFPVVDHIFFLCRECHGKYDRAHTISTADILAKRKTTPV